MLVVLSVAGWGTTSAPGQQLPALPARLTEHNVVYVDFLDKLPAQLRTGPRAAYSIRVWVARHSTQITRKRRA